MSHASKKTVLSNRLFHLSIKSCMAAQAAQGSPCAKGKRSAVTAANCRRRRLRDCVVKSLSHEHFMQIRTTLNNPSVQKRFLRAVFGHLPLHRGGFGAPAPVQNPRDGSFEPSLFYFPQYASMARFTKAAVPSPPAASMFSVNAPPAAYIWPRLPRIWWVQL